MKDADDIPVVVELAPLPREQLGPFFLLGVDKDADQEEIEAHWAQRVIWARKNQLPVPLHDINWAREVINDLDKRVRADVTSLNPDTLDRALATLARQYGLGDPAGPTWQPLDVDRSLVDDAVAVEVPDLEEVRRALVVPELPWEVPALERVFEEGIRAVLDPWSVELPSE